MRRKILVVISLSVVLATIGLVVFSRARSITSSAGTIQVSKILGGLESPWGIGFLPNGDFLVTERNGNLLYVKDGKARSVRNAPESVEIGQGGLLDLMIPRGGKSLVDRVQREARIPVLSHLEGICHVYVHHAANPQMAREIVLNAKMRRVGICGAAECLLIDRACAAALLPQIADDLHAAGCEMRGDEAAQALDARIVAATDSDWGHEFLAPILAIRVVDDLQMAMDHIAHYGSAHTDCIITDDRAVAKTFQQSVDSAIVLHNASTQFADGGEFGFGAEIGIATGKLHARGPVGATQLTSYAYYVDGDGQVRPD
ncbi:MAG: glutamate-5-semialdehyde dehydrogenase [Robiginitomaculum sp.]|nr:MAG: glutamate-5-semialdehyde dehydrogenase [Robiginitomaculum sp.]